MCAYQLLDVAIELGRACLDPGCLVTLVGEWAVFEICRLNA